MSDFSFLPAWREQSLGRRVFLRVSAASAMSAALVLAGCGTDTPTPVTTDPHLLTLPTGDNGLLYYAFLLASAKANLYQTVLDTPPTDLPAAERLLFSHMRDHEVVARELLHQFIDSTRVRILYPTDFAVSLASFPITTRAGVLAAAQQFETLTTAAYPPILPLFANVSQRQLLLKLSTVSARHLATVRDLVAPGSFASSQVVDATGQLITKTPTEVIAALAPLMVPYVVSVVNLPIPV